MAFSFGTPAAPAASTTKAPFSFSTPAAPAAPAASTPFAGFGSLGAPATSSTPFGGLNALSKPATTPAAPASTLVNPFASSSKPLGASTSSAAPGAPWQKNTRFEDMGESERKMLLEMEQFMHERTVIAEELKARTLGEEIKRSYDELQDIETSISQLQTSLAHLRRACADLKTRTEQDTSDRLKAQRIVDSFTSTKVGAAGGGSSQNARSVANFPHEYFTRALLGLNERLATYKDALSQVQVQMSAPMRHQAQAILPSLRAQHGLCLALAANLSALHVDLQDLKQSYTRMWRERVGSVRDPFEEARIAGGDDLDDVNAMSIS